MRKLLTGHDNTINTSNSDIWLHLIIHLEIHIISEIGNDYNYDNLGTVKPSFSCFLLSLKRAVFISILSVAFPEQF